VGSKNPDFELERLNELYALEILDTDPEERFDRYTRLVASVFDVPIVQIALLDAEREWIKSSCGLDVSAVSREVSLCNAALEAEEIFFIPDTLEDPRFVSNPLVAGSLHIRFYAGAVLRGPNGYPLGTLCLMDQMARDFEQKGRDCLIQFAKLIEQELQVHYLLKHTQEDLEKALFYNPLTEMPNRRLFTQKLTHCLNYKKEEDEVIVFSLMVKRFLHIKDVFGQKIAYEILNTLHRRLRKLFDVDLNIAHDEIGCFLLFMQTQPHFSKTPRFQEVVDTLLSVFNKPFLITEASSLPDKKLEMLAGGIGISISPQDGDKADELIEKAAVAMHMNPTRGQTFKIYKEKFSHHIARYFDMKSRLRHAIQHNQLDVTYQPIMNCETGQVCGVEALCRWEDPQNGVIPAADFIPVAEESGLVVPLGEYIFNKTCTHLYDWQKNGYPSLYVSINIAREQLLKESFHHFIKKTLQQIPIDPAYVRFEITESSFIEDLDEAINHMKDIIKMGISFAIDDFGTGYSSLSYLRRLPLSILKIDKSFIRQLTQNGRDASLTHSIISLSKSLRMTVIAEGVETKEQLLFLRAYQCDQVQGHLISKPLTELELRKFLGEEHRFGIYR